jgi:hypothetical protein
MLYPKRFQVRYSTVLVIVLLLMGSVLYEVTRTESAGRQSAARTQDISLPAPQPVIHRIVATARPDYVGRSSFSAAPSTPVSFDGDVALAAGGGGSSVGAAVRSEAAGGGGSAAFGQSVAARVRSSSSSGYAAGAYGMSGVGAWGGVSGMVRPEQVRTEAAPKAAKAPKAPKATKPKSNRNNGGGATSSDDGAPLLAGGFTTGAAAVEPGAVAAVETGRGASPGSSPAPTPEPMSLLLMGTGLVALYNVRHRFH